jgi:hypothetical protein
MAATMASKNLTRCAEVTFCTRFSKTLLGIETPGSLKNAWIWQRCIRLCWTRRSPIASAQVIKREEDVIVEGVSSRALTKSRVTLTKARVTGMPGLDQSIRRGNVATQRGVCFINLCIKLYFLSSFVIIHCVYSYLFHYLLRNTCVG